MEDKTIIDNTHVEVNSQNEEFLNNCIKEVCLNGDDITKYEKIINKYFSVEPDLYKQLVQLINLIKEQTAKEKVTQTSMTNLKFLANEVHITEQTIDDIFSKIVRKGKEFDDNSELWTDNKVFFISAFFLVLIYPLYFVDLTFLNDEISYDSAHLSFLLPASSFLIVFLFGLKFRKTINMPLIMWSIAAFWLILVYAYNFSYIDSDYFDLTAWFTNSLIIISLICIVGLTIFYFFNSQNRDTIALIMGTIASAMFVVSSCTSSYSEDMWYNIFVVAIILTTVVFWKKKTPSEILFLHTTIIAGVVLFGCCYGTYMYFNDYDYNTSFEFIICRGVLCVIILILIVVAWILTKVRTTFFFLAILLIIICQGVVYISTSVTDYDDYYYYYYYPWITSCAYPVSFAFFAEHLCSYFMTQKKSMKLHQS